MNKKMRLFEAFAGIGAQRKALMNIGAKFQVVGMAEWFVPAILAYQAIHNGFNKNMIDKKTSVSDMRKYLSSLTLSIDSKNPVKESYWNRIQEDKLRLIYTGVKKSEEEGNIFDVKKLHERKLDDVDILTYSFPCQDLSQQGLQKGMKKDSNTRSGLLWEIEKSLDNTSKDKLPKFLILENVMALVNKRNIEELKKWIDKLKNLGYHSDLSVLNSADFNSPQARRRAFMLSVRNEEIELPKNKISKYRNIKEILDKKQDRKNRLTQLEKYKKTEFRQTNSNIRKAKLIDYTNFNSEAYIYDPEFTGPTLTASGANSRIKIWYKEQIRKLNAKECIKYMGFEEKDYNKINDTNYLNENKIIYLAGNSISVQVLEAIFKGILRNEKHDI